MSRDSFIKAPATAWKAIFDGRGDERMSPSDRIAIDSLG
jgi:hypothetical protein